MSSQAVAYPRHMAGKAVYTNVRDAALRCISVQASTERRTLRTTLGPETPSVSCSRIPLAQTRRRPRTTYARRHFSSV